MAKMEETVATKAEEVSSLEVASREAVPIEVASAEDSEADRAAPDLTTRERTYPPEEEALITKREVRDHSEAVVASEEAISLKEAVECMEEEVAIAEVVSKMKMTDLVLVPSQESFLLLQEGEVNLLPTTLE